MPVIPQTLLEGNTGQKILALIGTGSSLLSAVRMNTAAATPIPFGGVDTVISFAAGTIQFQVPPDIPNEEPDIIAEIGSNGVFVRTPGVYLAIALFSGVPEAGEDFRVRIGVNGVVVDGFAAPLIAESFWATMLNVLAGDVINAIAEQPGGVVGGSMTDTSLMVFGPLATP